MTIKGIFRLGKAAGVTAALFTASQAQAQWFQRNCPPQPCQVPIYIGPSSTTAQPTMPSGQAAPSTTSPTPSGQAAQPQATPNLTDQLANAATNATMPTGSGQAGGPQNLAPNMIGDFFSSTGNAIQIPKIRPGTFDGATATANWPNSFVNAPPQSGSPINFTGNADTANLQVRLANGSVAPGIPPTIPLTTLGVFDPLTARSLNPFTPGNTPSVIPMNTNSLTLDQALAAARAALFAAENAAKLPGETVIVADVAFNGGNATRSAPGGPDPLVNDAYSISYNGSAQTLVQSNQTVLVNVDSPSGGGIFGRLKLSENNSPMPRDRVFFDYSYFSDVPIASAGAHVQVFRPGFEKTFLDGQASFELRVPFAATIDSTQESTAPFGYNTEFGNVTVAGKALLYSNGTWAYSAGCGLIMPTADDIQVNLLGIPLVRVNNEAYHIQPYLAALYTPNDRVFFQSFLQLDFCLNGNSVYFDPTITGNLGKTGHLNDQTSLFWDVGAGFWLVRNEDGGSLIRGIAPIIEFHYNQSLNNADIVALGALGVGDLSGTYSIINTTLGLNVDLRTDTSMMLGVVMPLTTDRQFNYELSLQLNQRFGKNGRAPLTSPDF